MSSLITPDSLTSARTAPRPKAPAPITGDQTRRLRQELMRQLRRGENALFRNPLTEEEVAAILDCSPRSVRYGVAEAEALLQALREVTADGSLTD